MNSRTLVFLTLLLALGLSPTRGQSAAEGRGMRRLFAIGSSGATATFTIKGTAPKDVVIVAWGPSIPGRRIYHSSDTYLILTDATGRLVGSNDDWNNNPAVAAGLLRAGSVVPYASSRDAAIAIRLVPGTYTTTASGGWLNLEIVDADLTPALTSKFSFLAFQAFALRTYVVDNQYFSPVLLTAGDAPLPLLVRGLGPGLARVGVASTMPDPVLRFSYTMMNDNFSDPVAAAVRAPALAMTPLDSALIVQAQPRVFNSFQVSGNEDNGIARIEFYDPELSITTQPQAQRIKAGESVTLRVAAESDFLPPRFQWRRDGVAIADAASETYTIATTELPDAGSYTCVVSNGVTTVTSTAATVDVEPLMRLTNFSARVTVGEGESATLGAVVEGAARDLLLRAVGPALAQFGVAPTLSNPRLALFDTQGLRMADNDDWDISLSPVFAQAGAFALPSGSRDAALVRRVTGAITMQAVGAAGAPGAVLIEGYDLENTHVTRVANFSVRTRTAGAGGTAVGFHIAGAAGRVLIRAVGPGLRAFNVAGTLADPRLQIFDGRQRLVSENDDWDGVTGAAMVNVGAFALATGSRDAAAVLAATPGDYTAVITGASGDAGEVLVEVYALSP